jgi:muramoyltetrapeptide carboxypeptidase
MVTESMKASMKKRTTEPKHLPGWNIGVAIVAPGGYAPDDAAMLRGIALLEEQGCQVRNYYEPAGKYQRFGGSDIARIAQIHAAARDPDVHIVMALRGGYGLSRILPDLNFGMLAESGKLFVGHSDFTAFHLGLLARTGAISFAGPMLCEDFTREDTSQFTMNDFWTCVSRPVHEVLMPTNGNPATSVSGRLWGGNLAMLIHLLATPFFPHIDGGILVLEDVNEHPYRVERMMLQLLHAGVLSRQKAVLFGDFSGYRLSEYDNGYDFSAMLAYLRSRVPGPLLTGLPFGHVRNKITLPIGCQAELVSDEHSVRLFLREYPVLRVHS